MHSSDFLRESRNVAPGQIKLEGNCCRCAQQQPSTYNTDPLPEAGSEARKMQPIRVGTVMANIIKFRPLPLRNGLARPTIIMATIPKPLAGTVRNVHRKLEKP